MKKIMSLLLVCVLALGALPLALAEGEPTEISIFVNSSVPFPADEENPVGLKIQEATNTILHVETPPSSSYAERLQITIASGEYPDALTACGKSPEKMKCLASVLCGMLSCLAGAHLSLGYLTMFSENMSASRGYVAFACVIFGRGNPPRVFLAALLFGFIDALGLRLQKYVPSNLTAMAPYLVTVVMMVVVTLRRTSRRKAGRA